MDLEFALEVRTLFSASNVAALSRCGERTSNCIPMSRAPCCG
jgi:hypothetical protein